MPIPELDSVTGYLPAGDHPATLSEVEQAFGSANYRRREIMTGVSFVVGQLRHRNVIDIWVNGSFVTSEPRPHDADVLYRAPAGVDPNSWTDILSPRQRPTLKKRHRVDLWDDPSSGESPLRQTMHDFWATDRDKIPKGLVYLIEDTN